jgi:hypothetical protein
MAFVRDLTPQVDARAEEQLDRDAGESSSEAQPDLMSPVAEFTICVRMAKNTPTNSDASAAARVGGRTNTTARGKLHGAKDLGN